MNGTTVPSPSAIAPIAPALRAWTTSTSKAVATIAKSRSIAPPINPIPASAGRSAKPFEKGQRKAQHDRDRGGVDPPECEVFRDRSGDPHQNPHDRESGDQRIGGENVRHHVHPILPDLK